MKSKSKQYFLAFDTSTEHLSVAVVDMSGNVLANHNELAFRHLSDNLHPAIEKCMADAEVEFKELSAIVCTKGPGSFTSVRVGLSAAKGFAFALNIPVITYDSLEAQALKYFSQNCTKSNVHVWVEAHGGNVYCATYNAEGKRQTDICSIPAKDAAQHIQKGDVLLGNGVNKHARDIPSHALTDENYQYIDASYLGLLAIKAYTEKSAHVGDMKPLYVHPLHYHKTYNADGTPIAKG